MEEIKISSGKLQGRLVPEKEEERGVSQRNSRQELPPETGVREWGDISSRALGQQASRQASPHPVSF